MRRCLAFLIVVVLLGASGAVGIGDAAKSTITIAVETSNSTFDCWFAMETLCLILARLWSDTLFDFDPQTPSKLVPLLATSWKYLSPTALEVKLRRGVKFHNGEPFDATAVKTTLEFMANPQSGALLRYGVGWLKQVEIVDDHTVRLIYDKPNAPSLQRLAQLAPIYPPKYYMDVKTQGFGPKPVGTGPYRLVRWIRDREAVFEANPDYFAGPKDKPKIQRIVIRYMPELAVRIGSLLSGDVDVITDVAADQVPTVRASQRATVHSVETNTMVYLSLDVGGRAGPGPFEKLQVRRAVAHAIDKDAITRRIMGGFSTRLDTMATPFMVGYTDNVVKYEYSPTRAKQLLAEAGYPDGFETELYGVIPDRHALEAVVGYLRAVGIRVNLRYTPADTASFVRALTTGKAPMSIDAWTTIFDADAVLSPYFLPGSLRTYVNSPKLVAPQIVEWLTTAAASINAAQRRELYSRVLKEIGENAYMVPLYSPHSVFAVRNDVDFGQAGSQLYPRYYALRWVSK